MPRLPVVRSCLRNRRNRVPNRRCPDRGIRVATNLICPLVFELMRAQRTIL
ncbi:hypothetical protein RSAG8_01046, partial [Rhizoctonia solani AG-8 WAC10335]